MIEPQPMDVMKLARQELAREGGTATFKKYGKAHMQKIGKMAAAKRWPKAVDKSKKSTK